MHFCRGLQKGVDRMNQTENKRFYRAADIMDELDCSESYAYQIIRQLNAELKKAGYLTASGRVPAAYFLERFGIQKKQ